MAVLNTEFIDKINEQLEGIITYIDNYVNLIETEIESGKDKAQQIANEKMEQLSDKLTEKLLPIRQKIIDIFKAQYQSALEKIKPIEPLVNADVSLDTIVDIVKSIIAILIAPYQPAIQFTTEVIPKVIELSNNLQKIANYQPTINIPGVEIPPLNVNIPPITPGDITG